MLLSEPECDRGSFGSQPSSKNNSIWPILQMPATTSKAFISIPKCAAPRSFRPAVFFSHFEVSGIPEASNLRHCIPRTRLSYSCVSSSASRPLVLLLPFFRFNRSIRRIASIFFHRITSRGIDPRSWSSALRIALFLSLFGMQYFVFVLPFSCTACAGISLAMRFACSARFDDFNIHKGVSHVAAMDFW